jgi:hypothetical protein
MRVRGQIDDSVRTTLSNQYGFTLCNKKEPRSVHNVLTSENMILVCCKKDVQGIWYEFLKPKCFNIFVDRDAILWRRLYLLVKPLL